MGILRTIRGVSTMSLLLVAAACSGRSGPVAPSPAAVQNFGTISVQSTGGCRLNGQADCFATTVRASAQAAAGAPTAPSGLTAVAAGSTVTLTWLAPTNTEPATTYVIEAGSAPGLANLANFSTGSSATTFTATGVGAGSYYVRVRAANASGISAASNEALLVVGGGCSPPGAPSGLTTVSVSGGTVVLAWTAGSGSPSTYIVEAGSAPGLANLANSDLGGPTTSLTATGVGAGTYYVRVRAKNACGTSPASSEVVVTVGGTNGSGLTGRWVGLSPNGLVFNPRSDVCDLEDDVQFDFVQSGSTLTGTITSRTRVPRCGGPVGTIVTSSIVNGTATDSGFSFGITAGTRLVSTFSGTVVGTRMSGVIIGSGDGSQVGTFAASRQP